MKYMLILFTFKVHESRIEVDLDGPQLTLEVRYLHLTSFSKMKSPKTPRVHNRSGRLPKNLYPYTSRAISSR